MGWGFWGSGVLCWDRQNFPVYILSGFWAHSHDSLAKLITLSALANRHIALSPCWKRACVVLCLYVCNEGWLTSGGKTHTHNPLILDLEILKSDTHTQWTEMADIHRDVTFFHFLSWVAEPPADSFRLKAQCEESIPDGSHHFCWIRFRD